MCLLAFMASRNFKLLKKQFVIRSSRILNASLGMELGMNTGFYHKFISLLRQFKH